MRTLVERRALQMQVMSAFALIMTGLAVSVETMRPGSEDTQRRTERPALPGFSDIRARTDQIRVTLADQTYTLNRAGETWHLDGPDGFPVRPELLAQLGEGIESLIIEEARTRDAAKMSALGLSDPREGGNGALIEFLDSNAESMAGLITGYKAGRVYVRRPGEMTAFRAKGTLPPLHGAQAWLDLDVLSIRPETIAAARLTDADGRSVYLRREPGDAATAFRPAPPSDRLTTGGMAILAGPALALSRLRPVAVRPARTLGTPAFYTHVTETFDGLEVWTRVFEAEDGTYLSFRAVEAGLAAGQASAINARAGGWAFRISSVDRADFAPDLGTFFHLAGDPAGSAWPDDTENSPEAGLLDDQDAAGDAVRQSDIGPPP